MNECQIDIPGLPDDLDGLKIAHLSDLHVGDLITPDHLPQIVDACNGMQADLIAATGDFIDFSNNYLPQVIDAMKALQAPLGKYFVLGNHDYLDDGHAVAQAFRNAGLNMLVNESLAVESQGIRVSIGGIDWAGKRSDLEQAVSNTCAGMPDGDLRILLAHHPHAFDPACEQGIDLVLSGHTHGGQIVLGRTRGRKGSIGVGSLLYRYPHGLYHQGDSRLHVSSGVGSWFPLRVKCPAEITCLELKADHRTE